MPVTKRETPLYDDDNGNTEVTPLAQMLREQMASTNSLRLVMEEEAPSEPRLPGVQEATAPRRKSETSIPQISKASVAAESIEIDPLANLLAPPKSQTSSAKSRRSTKEMVIPAVVAEPPKLPKWILGGLILSGIVNIGLLFALYTAHLQIQKNRGRLVNGTVITSIPPTSTEAAAVSACARDSTQTISGPERDQLLANVVSAYEMGRQAESLALLKRYVAEACDAATVQALAILNRDLSPPKKELPK